jgi:ATP-dependent helicase YprA (DUF1998 family)
MVATPTPDLDALTLAEHVIAEYAADLGGPAGEALTGVLERLVLDGEDVGQARSVARMRGPYLQALPPPQWSEQPWPAFAAAVHGAHAPYGFAPELIQMLSDRGFHRLYRFQEAAMAAVLDDQDLLVAAGTGRGKTESWLLPVLQYVLRAKDGQVSDQPVQSTKALLLYPTKALAQDQLRRLIRYLVPINRERGPLRRITVGIFDGDTPDGGVRQDQDSDYLNDAFRLFDCPVGHRERCATCPRHLMIERQGSRLTLALPRPNCRERVPLDWVVLTRRDMVREAPDILMTNPDILHLRLLNVNDVAWRKLLVEDPRFLVLDEIHTYQGTFGATVAWIIRRLRAARGLSGVTRPLRVIAASATVGNGPELFTRIAGVGAGVVQVTEEPGGMEAAPPAGAAPIPTVFVERVWATMPTTDWFADAELAAALGGVPAEQSDPDVLAELLYQRLGGSDLPPALAFVRWLYEQLRQTPMTPSELRALASGRYPALPNDLIEHAIVNGLAVASAAGLLESRAHLFSWPVDGYYLCTTCGTVYLSPRADCRCGSGFVTQLAMCAVGNELSAVGWLCPICLDVQRFLATADGQFVAYDPPRCAAGHPSTTRLRVVWRPYGRCSACGATGKQGDDCPRCGTPVQPDSGWVASRCQRCGAPADGECSCGGKASRVLRLPWVCGNANCATMFAADEPPQACPACATRTLLLGGLVEARVPDRCATCNADFLSGRGCGETGHAVGRATMQIDQFMLVDSTGRLRRPTQFRRAVPCYHRNATYALHRRYDSLSRSPANAAVTTAQAMLRRIVAADDGTGEGIRRAKLLSFSDSTGDMEQLARDFNDPENDTFVDQAIHRALANGPRPLAAMIEAVAELVPRDIPNRQRWQGFYLTSRVMSRFVRGHYPGRPGPPTLAAHGIADLFWSELPRDPDVQAVLAALAQYNGQGTARLRDASELSEERFDEALRAAREEGWITSARGLHHLNPERLSARLVGPGAPIQRTVRGRFVLTALHQLDPVADIHPFEVPANRRTDPAGPDFSRAARRIFSTPNPALLRGATYKGSTPKAERRKLEYQFAKLEWPNFLSSGPAMELGIDIGELDRVLLYGTPPNINAYLQRIGRAGRTSKQALVLSISKRNPIDLYYYRDPLRLIQSRAQPVPLQEHNERVVEAALTVAILDYVAGRFWIPWRSAGRGDEQAITCAGEPAPLGRPAVVPDEVETWVGVLWTRMSAVDQRALAALADLVVRHADEVRDYLRSLFAYALCVRCGYAAPLGTSRCQRPDCGGDVVAAADRFSNLVEEAIAHFRERIVDAPFAITRQYRTAQRQLTRRSLELSEREDDASPSERAAIARQRRQVDAQLAAVIELQRAAERETLWTNHQNGPYARFGYTIRGVDDQVEVVYVASGQTTETKLERSARAIGPALREFAPGAVSLQNTDEYVTLAVLPDTARTAELNQRLEQLARTRPRGCLACGELVAATADGACPNCGTDTWPIDTVVPGQVRAYRRDDPLGQDPRDTSRRLFPSHTFRLGSQDTPVESTFVGTDEEVLSFSPRRSVSLVNRAGQTIAQLDVGDVELLFTAENVAATYEAGERDGRPRLFELCSEPGCGGVFAPSTPSNAGFCLLDPGHDASRRRVVRLAHRFSGVGLRLTGIALEPDGHALIHGLRAGLEKVAGVLIRDIGEHVARDALYLFDREPGGAGVCELLLDPANDFINFRTAVEVAAELANCTCDDGCPRCLFQYGCARRNMPSSVSRQRLRALVDAGLDPQVRAP